MGLRFRKNIRLLPGVRLNLSKSGASMSLGGRGLTYNIGRKGTRATVGLPGTGLSHSTYNSYEDTQKRGISIWSVLIFIGVIAMLVIWNR
jgi:hypothetical protein